MSEIIVQSTHNTKGVLISDYATDYIFRGKTFTTKIVIENVIVGKSYLLFEVGSSGAIIRPASFNSTSGPVVITNWKGSDYTGGIAYPSANRNGYSSILAESVLKSGPTGTTLGTKFGQILLGSASGSPFEYGGGMASDDELRVVPPNSNILIEIDNKNAVTIDYFGFSILWYED